MLSLRTDRNWAVIMGNSLITGLGLAWPPSLRINVKQTSVAYSLVESHGVFSGQRPGVAQDHGAGRAEWAVAPAPSRPEAVSSHVEGESQTDFSEWDSQRLGAGEVLVGRERGGVKCAGTAEWSLGPGFTPGERPPAPRCGWVVSRASVGSQGHIWEGLPQGPSLCMSPLPLPAP